MKLIQIAASLALPTASGAIARDVASDPPNVMTTNATLPSSDTGWDDVKFEPGSARLFMARLKDGLTVFDVDKARAVTMLANSTEANGPILLHQYDRGLVAMDDGSLLSFALSDASGPVTRYHPDRFRVETWRPN